MFADKPSPPQNLQVVSASDKEIHIKWQEPEDDGGSEVTRYHVEVRESLRHSWHRVATVSPDDKLEYFSRHLMSGQQYMYRVAAENDVGISDYVEMAKPVVAKSKFGRWLSLYNYDCYMTYK